MLRQLSSLHAFLRPAKPSHLHHHLPGLRLRSSFTTSVAANLKQLPPRPKHPPESEIEESFLKGSGPGGQKINKTNSAVQLKHVPTGIVVKSQATRSRTQNRKIARDLLAQRLDELTNGAQSRTAIVADAKRKKAASKAKKSRRKYRELAASSAGQAEAEAGREQEQEGPEEDGRPEQGEGGAREGGVREEREGGRVGVQNTSRATQNPKKSCPGDEVETEGTNHTSQQIKSG